MNTNKLSMEYILTLFNDEKSVKGMKNIKKQLKQFALENNKISQNSNLDFLTQIEQKINTIISTNLSEIKNYFVNSNDNSFHYELFINCLFEKIKEKLFIINKNSKSIENCLFQKINKNTIKKIQSIIIIFMTSFYDFHENDPSFNNTDKIFEAIINKNIILEESFLISCTKIILILNKYIDKNKIKNTFNEKVISNTSSIKELVILLIKILNKLIIIKRNKDYFNIGENKDSNKNNLKIERGYYYFNYFELFLDKTYEANEPSLMKLLFDVIFECNLNFLFKNITKNDGVSKILLNSLTFDKNIRNKLIKFINQSPYILDKHGQKDLLKSINSNDSLTIIFTYISEDLKNKKYTSTPDLLEELKILYTFSLLIHSKDIDIQKIIIQLLNEDLNTNKEEKINVHYNKFITEIYKLIRNIPKYKYQIYNFILSIFDSIKILRKIISQIFFNNIKGKTEEYLEMLKNVKFENLFINNLSNSEPEVINNFFNFLNSLDKKQYLPSNEILQIISQFPYFSESKSVEALIENFKLMTNVNNKDLDIVNEGLYENNDVNIKRVESKEEKNNYYEFIENIYKNYMNMLFNIILEIKENINSLKDKSPFDNDVSITDIINANYNEDNKQFVSFEILEIFLDYLNIILKNKKMLKYFISLKFLDFFQFLVNNDTYKKIAYKLIEIFLKASNNDERNLEKNKQQILVVLNRFYFFFSKDTSLEESNRKNYDELYKIKELLLMYKAISIYFNKKLLNINSNGEYNYSVENLNEKIINFYFFYPEYLVKNSKECIKNYNNEYHSLIKNYLNIIFALIWESNQNIITKNNNLSPDNLQKKIKISIDHLFKFYTSFSEKKDYILDIIKYFIDKSFNFYFLEDTYTNKNKKLEEEKLSEDDFTLFYINKYKIKPEILADNNINKNKSIISNFCIQSPKIILIILKESFKYKVYLNQILKFVLFLCKINQQNIIFLLKQNLLKTLFKIIKEIPSMNDNIFEIYNLCFKYLQKEDVCYIFEQLIKLLNNAGISNNKELVRQILHCITNTLRILLIASNEYCKGIILTRYKIRQPNIYNICEINNLNFSEEEFLVNYNNNILIKQEIYFYKSLKAKKLLLLRLEKNIMQNKERISFKEKLNKNDYIEISFKNNQILVSENDEKIEFDDLSNYNSIFIENDNDKKPDFESHLKVNENNTIIYIFKEEEKLKKLFIYINGFKVLTYIYNFVFDNNIKIKIGFPLDLVKETEDTKFKMFNHIKLKSLKIFLQNKETNEITRNIYQLIIGKISCDYLFADELTNFKLDNNTKLISKYNNIYSARINSIFHKSFIKSQLYRKIFFTEILLSNSLDYLFRLEKYIFLLLNNLNIDKIIFNELILLLSTYLIINENFIPKFFLKDEFSSSLYFSLYRNAKFIDKDTIENLLSIILINHNKKIITLNNNIIINILLDIKLFNSINNQTKYDLISLINNEIIKKFKSIINIIFIIEKLSKILLLCQFNNKNDVDELILNILFDIFEENPKDNGILNIIEEIIYILFYFDKYSSYHLVKYKNGRINETSKIIYEYFNKIYNNESILHIKELLLKRLNSIILNTQIKEKLNRIILAYTPPDLIDSSNKNNLNHNDSISNLNLEDEDDDEDNLFQISNCSPYKVRSLSFSYNDEIKINQNYDRTFTGRSEIKKLSINNNKSLRLLFNKNKNKKCNPTKFYNYEINDGLLRNQIRRQQSSIKPIDDVILFQGVISGRRKSAKYLFKKTIEKRISAININLTNEDKEICLGDCHLCTFIGKLLISMFRREIQFGVYKNYLLHCLTEVFIMNKNLDFKLNFSYHLMKREGPNRIRKKFNIRIDKLLNYEYDRNGCYNKGLKKEENSINENVNDKSIKEESVILDNNNKEVLIQNEVEQIFMFYEDKKKYISGNLQNFFNLGQIYNINIISKLFDLDDKYKETFNCLLFRGLSYINAVLILGKNKIYILSSVNLSSNNILYDAHIPIPKRFWIIKEYSDLLKEHCKYLNSYDIDENKIESKDNNTDYNQNKKQLFEKTLKGFWLYSFYYVEINEIHKRRFLHQNNSIEIFLKNGKNYYLSFNLGIRDKIVKAIIINIKQSHLSKNIAFFIKNNYDSIRDFQKNDNSNYILNKKTSNEEINDNLSNMTYEIQNESSMKNENMIFIMDSNLFIDKSKKFDKQNFYKNIFKKNVKKTKYCLATITDVNEVLDKSFDKWTNGHLDTYSYLMILNTISGRTYNDIAQYPVYPWIIQNYTSNVLDLNNSETYRDFLYPIYAQDDETRENLKHKYDCFEEEQKEFRYHSGSHYSNAGFVCYYLIRIKPYSQLAAEVQGEYFDTTDRLFFNIESFYKVSEKYQELIPDFFNIPEIFINPNNFYFGLTSDKKNIDNVVLPPWASHSPRLFCKIMRKSLESQYVSTHINEWIDLIFGYKRKGVDAEKYYNALREVCSAFNPIKDCEDDIEIDQKINELCEMGIDPIQLFNKPHHKRERHQKIKAFFGKSIYLRNFKLIGEKFILKNFDNISTIKEMNKYYEYCFNCITKGEGGLSSFRMCYEEESYDSKEINNNLIYFIVAGKKTLLPPSYKNYFQWNNNNSFSLIKPFNKTKYHFIIHHMRKQIINTIKVSKDGCFIIIGYNNGVIEKYKLARIYGPKFRKMFPMRKKSSNISTKDKDTVNENPSTIFSISNSLPKESNNNGVTYDDNIYENIESSIMDSNPDVESAKRKKEKSFHTKKGLFNSLFGTRIRKTTAYVKNSNKKIKDSDINKYDDDENDEENRKIIAAMEKNESNTKVNNSSISKEILFDTQIPISTSNIINSDCLILNNKTGKFIQYNGNPSYFEFVSEKEDGKSQDNKIDNNNSKDSSAFDIPGFEFYSRNKNNLINLINKQKHDNSLSKHYIIFLINSSSRILSEISLIEICEPYSYMIVVDKLNNLFLYDFNTLDLIKYIDCSKYFNHKIKYISICPYTGDFIIASNYKIILMSINGVFITQMNNIKSKINHCFITSIHKANSDLYLFSAHENGCLKISKLVNNLNGIIFNMSACSTFQTNTNELLNSSSISELNNKYDPIRIQNISEVYHDCYNTNPNYNKSNDKYNKYLGNNNYFSTVFDTLIDIECSKYPIKFIKLSQDLSSLYCINSKNNMMILNYEDFINEQRKSKKNMTLCEKCQGIINSKISCAICGKKVCQNCKKEKIIAECSLRTAKPICEECSQFTNKNDQTLYDI